MAKGTKRKKTGVGIDFRRVKSKVGKKLPKAQNETDMTFKAKSINLPSQGLTEDKTGLAVSLRNLTTQELLSQTTHYSEKVRKEALQGLQQLFLQHPEEVRKQTGTVLGKLAECIGDADKGVRAALKDLFSKAVLPQLQGPLLGPFLPLVMAHLFSALTSMTEAVRTGALDFLELLMGAAPRQVMQNYLGDALQHFVELLSPVRRSNSVSAHSVSSILQIVKALQSLLSKAAAGASAAESHLAQPSHTASGPASPEQSNQSLFHQRCQWFPVVADVNVSDLIEAAQSEAASVMPLSRAEPTGRRPKQAKPEHNSVCESLLEALMSCWTECAPGQLAAGPELTAVQCMEATLQCMDILLHHLPDLFPSGVSPTLVDAILKKVTPHMPTSAPAVKPTQAMQHALVQLNLAAAQLLSRFLPTRLGGADEEEQGWQVQLLDYYVGIMEAGQVLPSRQALSEEVRQANMPVEVCTAALQGVQEVLPFVSPPRRAVLLAAVCTLSTRSAARSGVKAACLTFQHRLLAKGGQALYPDPRSGVPLLPEAVLIEWLLALPRLLWELGSSKPATSHMALGLLHSALCFAPAGSALSATLDGLQPQLCPLYCSLLAPRSVKGSTQAGRDGAKPRSKVVVPGPLAQLPAHTQELAVDLLFYYPSVREATARTCALVCLTDFYSAQLAFRVTDVLSARPCQHNSSVIISFLTTVLLGQVSQAQLSVDRRRHAALVEAVGRAVCSIASADDVPQAMEPALLQHSSASAGMLAWQGTLAVAAIAAESFKARRTERNLDTVSPDSSTQKQLLAALPLGSTLGLSNSSPQLWAALPAVMAYFCLDERQPEEPAESSSGQQQAERLTPVLRLLQADPLLIKPFIDALVTHCQHGQTRATDDSQPRQASSKQGASQKVSVATLPARVSGSSLPDGQQQDTVQTVAAAAGSQQDGASVDGNFTVLAAVEALLVICEQRGLLAYLLELQHHLFDAATSLRAMANAMGAASQAGAAATRKIDSLVTVLQALTGTSNTL